MRRLDRHPIALALIVGLLPLLALAAVLYVPVASQPQVVGGGTGAGGGSAAGTTCGRLTLTTGVPVTTADVTAATTIYYTPYGCGQIGLYDGTAAWNLISFTEVSLALGTLTSGKNYDVFGYNNAGVLTLEFSAAWTTDTARADALTTQNGVYVKSGTTTRRYLGTFRTTSTTQTEDSAGGTTTQVGGKRFVYNAANRVPRWAKVIDTTNSWSYTTATWRVANGATGPVNCVEFLTGLAEDVVDVTVMGAVDMVATAGTALVGVGFDSTTAPSGLIQSGYNGSGAASEIIAPVTALHRVIPSVGYHFACWLEKGAAATAMLFLGDNGADGTQTGVLAIVRN